MQINHVGAANLSVDQMSSYLLRSADITVLIGPDSLDVLHSVTTQAVSEIPDNSCVYASILSSNGRMIDRILIWNLVDQIALIHLDGCAEPTRNVLSKSVSWKQDVKIIPLDSGFLSLWEYNVTPSEELFSVYVDGRIHSCGLKNSIKVHLGPRDDITELVSILSRDGASEMDDYGTRLYNIMNGMIDGNIVRNFSPIPLEVSLEDDISFTKGCYTGQEIIARLDARGSLSRTLVSFESDGELNSGRHKIIGGGKLVVYDSINSDEKWVNIGLIHPDLSEPGNEFLLDGINCKIFTNW